MKRSLVFLLLLLGPAVCVPANAGTRASASYTITSDTLDGAGTASASAAYQALGSAGEVIGTATAASPAVILKHGHLGQLLSPVGLELSATLTTIPETSTTQLSASLLNDDQTFTALLASAVTWSAPSGPLSIAAGGLGTAGTVYQTTAATAQASYGGLTGTLPVTVTNTNNDDLPGYSSDGLDDAWQVQFFGLSNPAASPLSDADGDGLSNLFEFITGTDPTNPIARFQQVLQPAPALPGQMQIVIAPCLADRTYIVLKSSTLGPTAVWTPLDGFTSSDNGSTRTITDTNATLSRQFYRVQISKP